MGRIVNADIPTQETRAAQADALCRRYSFLTKQEIGKSVLGRPIYALKLGDCDDAVLYAAAFHALEWLTAMVVMRFLETLCMALDEGRQIAGVDCRRAMLGRGLVLVPCVNPDGVELVLRGRSAAGDLADEVERISGGDLSGWSANARGVDLNHNYDAGWHIARQLEHAIGIDGPSPRRFGGTAPESEPETQAMVRLCERMDFRSAIAFHSQGEEIYWKYGEHTPQRAALMARVLAVSAGYEVAQPEGISSHAGFKDWFIERYHRPAFTVELGRGENPLSVSELMPIYERVEELLMLGVVM